MTRGKAPTRGLESRTCPVCERRFQPYRSNQFTCSRDCYRQQTFVRERENAARRNDLEGKKRRNDLRRGRPQRSIYSRKRQLHLYKLTVDDYDRMLAAQDGKCILCGNPPKPDGVRAAARLHVDHDHVTGQNRDLVCVTCNVGIGMFKDDPALLRKAAEYIERHRASVSS